MTENEGVQINRADGKYAPGRLDGWVVWDEEQPRAAGATDGDHVVYVLTAQDVAAAYDHMAEDVEKAVRFADLTPDQQHECVVAAEEALNRWHWMHWIYESMAFAAQEYRRALESPDS